MNCWYIMITIDVVLNWNQSLFKNYRKKFREMETQREHITQIEWNLESLSALVLILKKKSFSITFGKKHPRIDLKSMCLYKICHNWKSLDFLQYSTKTAFLWIKQHRVNFDEFCWHSPLSLHLLVEALILLSSLG